MLPRIEIYTPLWAVFSARRCLENHAVFVYKPADKKVVLDAQQRKQDLQGQLVFHAEEDKLLTRDDEEDMEVAEACFGAMGAMILFTVQSCTTYSKTRGTYASLDFKRIYNIFIKGHFICLKDRNSRAFFVFRRSSYINV